MRSNALRVFLLAAVGGAGLAQDSLTLERALEIAGQASPEIQLARLRVVESQALAAQSRSALGPQANGIVQGTWQVSNLAGIGLVIPGFKDRVGPYTTFNARPQVSQTLFDASLLASTRAARERSREAAQDAEIIRQRTWSSIIQLYLQAAQADSRVRASAARVETAEALYKQVSDRVSGGTANRLDLARTEEQLQRERAALIYAKRDRDVVTTVLAKTIGLDQAGPLALAPLPEAAAMAGDPPALLRTALDARPELKSLAVRKRVLEQELAAATRGRWPKIGAIADAGAYGATPAASVYTYTVAATLTVPIWTSGRVENEIKAAKVRLEQWEQERRQAEQSIRQEIAQAWTEWRAAQSAGVVSAKAAVAARESLALARLRYESGLATNLDVATAQGNRAQAEEEEIRTRFDSLAARARLAYATGDALSFVARR